MEQQNRQEYDRAGEYAPDTTWPRPRNGLSQESQDTPSMPEQPEPHRETAPDGDSASLSRIVAIVVSAGLAWATGVTLLAWILGRLLSK